MIVAYAIFSFLLKKKVVLFGESDPGLPKFSRKSIQLKQDTIAAKKGKWYEINQFITCDSEYVNRLRLENNWFIRFQSWFLRNNKTVFFYKQSAANIEYKLLRDIELVKDLKEPVCFLLPKMRPYKILAECYLTHEKLSFSWSLSLLYVFCGIFAVIKKIGRALLLRPVRRSLVEGLVLKRLGWRFGRKGYAEDMLIDDIKVRKADMVYYAQKNTTKSGVKRSIIEARERNHKIIVTDNDFNFNICYCKSFLNNILLGSINLIFVTFGSPSLLFSLSEFTDKSVNSYQLYSFCKVSYHWSVGNWHDIVETIVAEDSNIRMFMYAWSDYAQCYVYQKIFTVHNDLFLWGPIQRKIMFQKGKHDRVYCIGCLFSNGPGELSDDDAYRKLELSRGKPVVVFYDSPVDDGFRFSRIQFDDFLATVKQFAKENADVQVVLKPKSVTDEYRQYFKDVNITLAGYNDIYLQDIIRISSVNIGMGVVAPIAVSLILGKPGFYYDTGGNKQSPLTRHEGELVFRDKKNLFENIKKALSRKIWDPDIEEIKDYNVPDADPLDILRTYVKTGAIDEKYRIK